MNTPLVANENIEINELPDGTSVLKFQKTELNDGSAYIARASNKMGDVDAKVNLTVKEIKPQILSDIVNVSAIRDESAQFTIRATGNPQPTIRWFKNDNEELTTSNGDFEFIHDVDTQTFTLKIVKCRTDHQADYSAVISNSGGTIKSKKGKLTVTKAAEFIEKPQSMDVNENDVAEFRVRIDAFPSAKITWLFDGKPATPKDGFEIQTDAATGSSVLMIKQALPKHSGKITVKAENSSGSIEETVQCSVKSKLFSLSWLTGFKNLYLHFFPPQLDRKSIKSQQMSKLSCILMLYFQLMSQVLRNQKLNGNYFNIERWMKIFINQFYIVSAPRIHRGEIVKPSGKYEVVEESATVTKLIIHDVTVDDESPVQIKVKNSLGESETIVQLKALGKYEK